MLRLTFVHIIAMFTLAIVPARGQQKGQFKQLPQYPFVLVSNDTHATVGEVSDSLFNACARGVRFAVNSTELRATEPFLKQFRDSIAPRLISDGLVLRKIVIKGAASPEGPRANNVRLGKGRTRALVDFINTTLGTAADTTLLEQGFVCEDYEQLTILLREAADKDYDAVRRIWQESKGDEVKCKKALMRLNGGRSWARWKQKYFPQLRQARIMMWFGEPIIETPTDTMEIKHVVSPEPADTDTIKAPVIVPAIPIVPDTVMTFAEEKLPRLPLIALRTNLVHDFFYMPQFGWAPGGNIQLEFFPKSGHLTYNVGFTFTNHRHWKQCKFFQIRNGEFELRRYFKKGHPYRGGYLGAYLNGFVYGIGLSQTRGWEGEGGGAGISGGYTVKLTRNGHFRLELSAAVGFIYTRHDPYVYGNPITGDKDGKYYYDYHGNASSFKKRNHQATWIGPTNLGISLTYDIVYRKRQKGGAK